MTVLVMIDALVSQKSGVWSLDWMVVPGGSAVCWQELRGLTCNAHRQQQQRRNVKDLRLLD